MVVWRRVVLVVEAVIVTWPQIVLAGEATIGARRDIVPAPGTFIRSRNDVVLNIETILSVPNHRSVAPMSSNDIASRS